MTNPLEPYQQRYREANAALDAFDTDTLTTSDGQPDETAITTFSRLSEAQQQAAKRLAEAAQQQTTD